MTPIVPGRALYQRVRGAFVTRGFSLARWCKENAISYSTARDALLGSYQSYNTMQLREKIVKDARL